MRKAWRSQRASIILYSATSPSMTVVSSARGLLTEQGQCKLIAQKEWRAKLAHAISVGIESYRALGIKKQPPLLVADYRKQIKSAPDEFAVQEAELKEADTSIINLVGKSAFPPPQQTSTPRMSLESAPIVP